MQQQQQLPDEEQRQKLEDLLDNLTTARDHIPAESDPAHEGVAENLDNAADEIHAAISEVKDHLDFMPEWDGELVRDLVLDNAGRRDTVTERVDGEVVLRFGVGQMGDETECRYATEVTTGNEWFHVRQDDDADWNEVWRN